MFQGVAILSRLAAMETWSDAERRSALESLALIAYHPENCDELCQYVAHLPTGEQSALLDRMQALRLQRTTFAAYALERSKG